jgi:[ribosomal protein S5]-alanine N-acetyltransferase
MKLRTSRLTLEPLQPEDEPALHYHWTQPEVRRFLWDGRSVEHEEVRDAIATSARLFRNQGIGLWAVRPSDEGTLIGCGGFWYFHVPPELELVVSLSPANWGRGLGEEAARALVSYVFDALGWSVVQASADEPNHASLALIRRLGMTRSEVRPGAFGATEVYRVAATDWEGGTGGATSSDH